MSFNRQRHRKRYPSGTLSSHNEFLGSRPSLYRLPHYEPKRSSRGLGFGDGNHDRRASSDYNPTPELSVQTSPTEARKRLNGNGITLRGKGTGVNSVSTPPYSSSELIGETKLSGTNAATGENPVDNRFEQCFHHISHLSLRPFRTPVDILKNYRVVYDPELDASLPKAEKKLASRKLRFQTEHHESPPSDPRVKMGIHNYFSKPNKASKKLQFKHLPQPRFVYDKNSLGLPPLTELVVWDLPSTTTEVYFSNFFESFGSKVKDVKFLNDSTNAVPLGVATFSFQGSPRRPRELQSLR